MALRKQEKGHSSQRGNISYLGKYPRIYINLEKIKNNARLMSGRCADLGISVVAVTKSILGNLKIAETLLESGISMFADSRLDNLVKLRKKFRKDQLMQLRTPMLSETDKMVETCGMSMSTNFRSVEKMEKYCKKIKKEHKIIIMLDIDDEREGLLPGEVLPFCRKIKENCRFVKIYGLGTNARCISEKEPERSSLFALVNVKNIIKRELGIDINILSGGNSSLWNLIDENKIPKEINQARIGEAIFIGNETINYSAIEGAYQDCFILEAEVIEVKKDKRKAILGLGLQDINMKDMSPVDKNIKIISQSSDHSIVGIEKKGERIMFSIGDKISFNIKYFGLLSCMTSPFVKKIFIKN